MSLEIMELIVPVLIQVVCAVKAPQVGQLEIEMQLPNKVQISDCSSGLETYSSKFKRQHVTIVVLSMDTIAEQPEFLHCHSE